MSDSTLTGNAPVRQNITRKNVIIGLLLLLFVLIALWCHGRPVAAGLVCWDLRRWWR